MVRTVIHMPIDGVIIRGRVVEGGWGEGVLGFDALEACRQTRAGGGSGFPESHCSVYRLKRTETWRDIEQRGYSVVRTEVANGKEVRKTNKQRSNAQEIDLRSLDAVPDVVIMRREDNPISDDPDMITPNVGRVV